MCRPEFFIAAALLASVAGCVTSSELIGATSLPDALAKAEVAVPRTWPTVIEALVSAHRQTGLRYAVVPPVFRGVIGPFEPGEIVPLQRLIASVAAASGTSTRLVGDVVVFDPRGPDRVEPSDDLRQHVRRLAENGRSWTIPELSRLVSHENASVRFHALAALHRMEGDFLLRAWPGRVSIFEVMREQLDRDAMLWAVSEGGPEGAPTWKMAIDVLARAREPYVGRYTWQPAWGKVPGSLPLSLWAMGRSGDASTVWSLVKRVRQSFTNDSADRYLAAVALGELDAISTLHLLATENTSTVETRRATAYGLGACRRAEAALPILEKLLADADPGVQYVACQSLGRLRSPQTAERLARIASDSASPLHLRCAALDGLALAGHDAVAEAVVHAIGQAPSSENPHWAVAAKVADIVGAQGGARAEERLLTLLRHDNRYVRAAAICSLGTLGTRSAVARVEQYMRDATDADGLIAAMAGLGRGRSPLAKDALGRIAVDAAQPERLRLYALLALAQLAGRSGHDTVRKAAAFGSPEYLSFALRHLDLGTPAETFAFLKDFLARGEQETSAAAACRIAELGHGPGIRELLEGFDVFYNHARMMHMWGAIRAQGPEVIPALIEGARSSRSDIRRSAALALGGRREVAAVDTLLALARDPSPAVRYAAAQSLGLCGDPAAVPLLIDLAEKDDDPRTMSAAIRVLRFSGFNHLPEVRALFARLAGTERDCGVIPPNTPSVAEQPANSFVLRRWDLGIDDEDMCPITYETSLTYDSDRGRVVLWGAHGRRADSPQTGETWFYDAAANSWTRLIDSREWPNATCLVTGTAYDPVNQVVVSPLSGTGGHGWVNSLRIKMQYSIPWVLDARSGQWFAAQTTDYDGALKMVPHAADTAHGVVLWWQGDIYTYDAYSNEWHTMKPSGPKPQFSRSGGAFDTKRGRFLAVGEDSTWAYDLATNRWTDLKPAGNNPAGCPVVYDAANDVLLAFRMQRRKGVQVSVYHIDENRWEDLPHVRPNLHYGTLDLTYDSRNNVVVFSGGWETGRSGEATVRETWTYRYKPAAKAPAATLGRPRDLVVATEPGGAANLSWQPPASGEVKTCRVYRGVGDRAWLAQWQKIAELPPDQRNYRDTGLDTKKLTFYRVAAVDAAGNEWPVSYPARTAPPALRFVGAVFDGKGVRLSWTAATAPDIVGYHVYRAPVEGGSYWLKRFNAKALAGKFVRITQEPAKSASFYDTDAKISGAASEFAWPDSYAYIVRAVNAWGIESGPSPATLALPDAPGPIRIVPWLDGRRLVLWSPCRAEGVSGYYVMRQDDWHEDYAFRWHPAPLAAYGMWDDVDFPTADRRQYYINGVDALGALGIPSAGAWSHGLP